MQIIIDIKISEFIRIFNSQKANNFIELEAGCKCVIQFISDAYIRHGQSDRVSVETKKSIQNLNKYTLSCDPSK